jgi:hypothetical protein|tara:strand:- start:3733 stop:4161 length:429 start_codon:yes stop_codon:yes gene_type:complete
MRLSDFLLLTMMSAVMITGASLIITDIDTNYPNTMNISQLDVMNITTVQLAANNFETDIRAAQSANGSFVSTILNGIGAAGSLVGLTMASVDQLVQLSANIMGTVFNIADPNGAISGLLTGALVMIIALLIISIVFRWELTK